MVSRFFLNSVMSRMSATQTAFSELLFSVTEDIQAMIIVRYPTAKVWVRCPGTPNDSRVLANGSRTSKKEEAIP